MSAPAYGETPKFNVDDRPTKKEMEAAFPNKNHLVNEQYAHLLTDYFGCVTSYLNQWSYPQMLVGQMERRDLDTVCAYELYQMKKGFLETKALDLSSFVPKQQ